MTWETRSTRGALDLAASPKNTESVLGIDGQTGRLIVSTDGAVTWDELVDAPVLRRVQWLDDSVVGMTADGTMYSATGPRQQWSVIGQLGAEPVAFTTRNGAWWVVTDGAAVMHSDDGQDFRFIYEPPARPGL